MKSRKLLLSFSVGAFLCLVSGDLAAQEGAATAVQPVKPGAVSHDVAGKENCLMCHSIGASPVLDVPEDHAARSNESCMWCHASDSPMLTAEVTNTPHARATEETDCMMCHAPEANPEVVTVSESHTDRPNGTCMWCHVKVEGGGGRS